MKLHPAIAALMEAAGTERPTTDRMTPQEARALHERIAASMIGLAPEVGSIRNFTVTGPVGEIAARIYYPQGEGPFPVLLFIHGGGWIGGNLETHEVLCREFVAGAECAVAALAYRLAPEHKFPAAFDDCRRLRRVRARSCDGPWSRSPTRSQSVAKVRAEISAAAVAQSLRGRAGNAPMFQVLAYPATDLRMTTPSYDVARDAPGLTSREIAWCVGHYLTSAAEILDVRASPNLATDLSGLPPTLIVTAEVDPIRDDGEAYARRLVEAGIPVQMRRYLGLPHGFLSYPRSIQPTSVALDDVCRALTTRVPRTSRFRTATIPAGHAMNSRADCDMMKQHTGPRTRRDLWSSLRTISLRDRRNGRYVRPAVSVHGGRFNRPSAAP